jgi:plasmid replication initiation protein
MMNSSERKVALQRMDETIRRFYSAAVQIGNHPFIEFAGVMQAYLKTCQRAHEEGIDFTECNRHAGQPLPMEGFEITYLNEKLACIFDGRIIAAEPVGLGAGSHTKPCG